MANDVMIPNTAASTTALAGPVAALSVDTINSNSFNILNNYIFNASVVSSSFTFPNNTTGVLSGGDTPFGPIRVPLDLEVLLTDILGSRRKDLPSVITLTVVYLVIFLTGLVGNLSTCIVIARNSYMRTATNYYLFSLAVSDLLTLLFALPPELYSIWEAYPWKFGLPFCIVKSYLNELTPYASVLTITAFTVERYLAICHPLREQRGSRQARAFRCVVTVWVLSALCALPYPVHTRVFPWVVNPMNKKPIDASLVCNIPAQWLQIMIYCFQVSTFVFFVLPMVVITIIYMMIGMRLRNAALTNDAMSHTQSKTVATRARRAVIRMLVAVVVAFFVCWAPFHAQRLMTVYIKQNQWTPQLLTLQSHLFYVSGVLYFLSCTINPILYNLLSRKFRQAFKRTLCRCCLGLDVYSIPVLYRLKAKFVDGEGGRSGAAANAKRGNGAEDVGNALLGVRGGAGGGHRLYTKPACFRWASDKGSDIHLVHVGGAGPDGEHVGAGNHFNTHGCRMSSRRYKAQPSTKETTCVGGKNSTSSSSGAHAHSDGRLHRICRHKYCPSGRAAYAEGLTPPSIRTQSTSSGMRQQQAALTPQHNSGDSITPCTAGTLGGTHKMYDTGTPEALRTFKGDVYRTVRLINSHPNITHSGKDKAQTTKMCRASVAISY